MRKMVTVLAVLGLLAGSCGGSDADSCEGLADQSIDVVQRWLDELDAMTPEEMLATEEPAFMSEMETEMLTLQLKSEEAGCSTETMNSLIEARVDRLSSDSEFGQMMLELLKSEGFSE